MRNIAFFALTSAATLASPAFAKDGEAAIQQPPGEYIPPPAPPPISQEDEQIAVPQNANRRAYVSPSDYEALGPRPSDYPLEALRQSQEGDVGYLLYVGADGKPEACEITDSSGFDLLDEATCKLMMERGKFQPATDGAGKPVLGEFSSRYRWAIKEPEYAGTMTVHVAYTVGENGASSDCDVIEVSGTISERMRKRIEREPCPGIDSLTAPPYRDENGVPVAKRVSINFQVTVEDIDE